LDQPIITCKLAVKYRYYYDLRNCSAPLNVYKGHGKAVSYVKFLNAHQMLTASTDSTLRVWELSESDNVVRTYTGHTNEKNFVGLGVNSDGSYISCGSETNTIYTYLSPIAQPVLTHYFGNPRDNISVFFC
jgi:E3 ubiquitin-protein ligase RFWD2